MSEINIVDLAELTLKREKQIIESIMVKACEGKDFSTDYQALQEASKRSNTIIQKVMDQGEEPEFGSLLESAVDTFNKLSDLEDRENVLKYDFSFEEEAEYSLSRMSFASKYYTIPGIADRLLWYYGIEEEKPDSKIVVDLFLNQEHNIIPIRNTLLGIDYKKSIRNKDVNQAFHKEYLEIAFKMMITHYFSLATMSIAKAIYENKNSEDAIQAIILLLKLAISTAKDNSKELGLEFDEVSLEDLIEEKKRTLLLCPRIEDHPEVMDEFDHLLENANQISGKYKQAGQK